MSNYSLMNIILISSTLFFAALTLYIILKRTKEKKDIIKAIENNNAAYEQQFLSEEEQLRKTLGNELGTKLNDVIKEIITVEKESYKKLCTLFIDHQGEAIELLPFTMSQITTAYGRCLGQLMNLLKDHTEVETFSLQESKNEEEQLSQYEALIEQLRSEKLTYSDKYKEAHNLLIQIYSKYKEKLELSHVELPEAINLTDLSHLFKMVSLTAVEEPKDRAEAKINEANDLGGDLDALFETKDLRDDLTESKQTNDLESDLLISNQENNLEENLDESNQSVDLAKELPKTKKPKSSASDLAEPVDPKDKET